jgi:hypothetical protein
MHDYLNDLHQIRTLMERSSKFHLLSGWAGISAGICALASAYHVQVNLKFNPDSSTYLYTFSPKSLIITAVFTFSFAFGLAVFFSYKRAKKQHVTLWNTSSKRLMSLISFPLMVGGIFSLLLAHHGLWGLVAPILLLFYGISLFVISPFTLKEVGYLGIIQVLLGLINLWLPEYGLLFWIAGFGIAHIIYGMYMYVRYEREN